MTQDYNPQRFLETMFVTPIFVTDIPHDMRINLVESIRGLKNNNKGHQKSYYYWQTDDQLFNDKSFSQLVSYIKKEINEVFDYLKIVREDVIINNMWANITSKDYFHQTHVHPNSYISGLIYLNVSKNSAPTTFGRPGGVYSMIQPEYKETTVEQQIQYLSKPKNGKMILWDSSIPHMVANSTAFNDEERITLAFTALPKGTVNKTTAKINF